MLLCSADDDAYSERAKRMNLCAWTVRPSTTKTTSENCGLSTIDSKSPERLNTAAAAGFCRASSKQSSKYRLPSYPPKTKRLDA